MFQENKKHLQSSLFTADTEMNNTRKLAFKNSWSGTFYNKIFRAIDEKLFDVLYDTKKGRPNFPVNILVGLEILKEMYSLTDEQLYENYHFNFLYQNALGVEDINEYSFSIRTLYHFRCALVEYQNKEGKDLLAPIFANGRDKIIEELGLKTGLQRTDSVMICANIKRMSRFTLFHKVLSNLVKELLKQNETVSDELKELVSEKEDAVYYRLTKSQVAETLDLLAKFLYVHVERWKEDVRINQTEAYLNANRLLKEQCRVVNPTKIELVEPKDIPSGSLQNPADVDATHKTKREENHYGYAVHGTETCAPENPIQVITSIETVQNNVDDAKVLAENISNLKEETGLETIICDGAYVSDVTRGETIKNEVTLIATAIRGKAQEEGKLDSLSFELNDKKIIEKCPNGERPKSQKLKEDGTLIANFDVKKCKECPLKEKCMAYKGKQSRLVIDTKRRWLDERNANLRGEAYQELCRMRPPVEGLMEKLKPKYLRGRILFRRLTKVKNRMTLRAIGLNFKRYLAWILHFFSFLLTLTENKLQKLCQFIFAFAK